MKNKKLGLGIALFLVVAFTACTTVTAKEYLVLGNSEMGIQRYDEAIKYFERGLEKYPNSEELKTALEKAKTQKAQQAQQAERQADLSPEGSFAIESIRDGKVRITSYIGTGREVRIPSTIRGKPVAEIWNKAFFNRQLTSVTIPNSVTTIGNLAFEKNRLTSVVIPNSVTYLSGFKDNQLTSVVIPNSVTSIGSEAFRNNRLTNIAIPNSVKTIESMAFSDNQLTSVTIGNSVTQIPAGVFQNNKLTSVTIPNSVTFIGKEAFQNNRLTSITIGANVRLWTGNIIRGQLHDFGPSFDNGFDDFYRAQGSRAGTYTYSNGQWRRN